MAELVKDVVCGMDVDPDTAPAKSEHRGTTYYFCAEGCKQEFDADPRKFLNGAAPAAAPAAGPPPVEAAAAPRRRWWEFWK